MAGTLTVSGGSFGLPSGANVFGPVTTTGAAMSATTELVASLTTGDNTIPVPSGAVAVWIIPPTGSVVALKVRFSTNAADAGLPIAPGAQTGPIGFATAAPTTVIVNAASAVIGVGIVFI